MTKSGKGFHKALLCLLAVVNMTVPSYAREIVHHELKVLLKPEKHYLEVEDKISLPDKFFEKSNTLIFKLHKELKPLSGTAGVKILPIRSVSPANELPQKAFRPQQFKLSLPSGMRSFVIKYRGFIDHPVVNQEKDYGGSFGETPGLISPEGIYLDESTAWYPVFENSLMTFTLDVRMPGNWKVVSQGMRAGQSDEKEQRYERWETVNPQQEIYLTGGKFIEYSRREGVYKAQAFLRSPDKPLADKYLKTTLYYLDLFSRLLGSYPYKKFALVENFWETGYGMPSFTLLGPAVIRLPFILHSSYPHEILHNWFGNGVYVDYRSGNWCEGLTTYLADHLIKEQRGKGVEYRRNALQRYKDFVSVNKDFPLTEFRSRHSSVTQSVGYDKTMMFFHMLRKKLGDEIFKKGLRKFYRNNKFKPVSFDEVRKAFAEVSGKSLQEEFDQWITRAGAPQLKVEQAKVQPVDGRYLLTFQLKQIQTGPAYRLSVPLSVYLKDWKKPVRENILMKEKSVKFSLRVSSPPLRMVVDPEFDLFRRLDRQEIPPALSQALGADKTLIVLPSQAPDDLKNGYLELAEDWKKSLFEQAEIKFDNEIEEIPADRSSWLFGWRNRFRDKMNLMLKDYQVEIDGNRVRLESHDFDRKNHSLVLTARHLQNQKIAVVWIAADQVSALPGLKRKLPHYRKYSYLAFKGDDIKTKGQWPIVNSPLSIPFKREDGRFPEKTALTPMEVRALVY